MASPNVKYNKDSTALNELYETPIESLHELVKHIQLTTHARYLEPCDGMGMISGFLKDSGYKDVTTNELYSDTYKSNQDFNENFLTTDKFDDAFDCVIMNPPFKMAKEFIIKALEVAPRVIVFSRLTLLESKNRYRDLFSKGVLHTIYLHTERVGCRKGVQLEDGSISFEPAVNAVAYCWYEFRREPIKCPEFVWMGN